MEIIDKNTVVIFTSTELKDALQNDNEYNHIFLGANITLESGIKINSKKTTITIDGTYKDITYQFEDRKSLSASDTITISSAVTTKVIVSNMNIIGNNYYGIIYVPESNTYKNITIEYNNITYTGPQISFNPVGTTSFIDSTITIKDTSLTTGNEVAECNKIEIGGTSTITHLSKSNSAFWFRNDNPSFTILENSNVKFISESRELFYGTNNLTFTILNNSYFDITTYNGMAYQTFGTGKTIIDDNSTFILKQTNRNGSYATWYSYGTITLNEGSTLHIINDFANITSSNYNIYFNSATSEFILNNPKEVVLFNSIGNTIYTRNKIPFSFTYTRLNTFNTAINIKDNISINTLPTYSWYKSTTSVLEGTFNNTTTTITNNNYTTEELANIASLSNLNIANNKIFSIGDTLLKLNPISDESIVIEGITEPYSSVLIEYNNNNFVIESSESGNFSHSLETTLPIGTEITFNIKKYNLPIYYTKKVTIIYNGEITLISAPKDINFKLLPLSFNPIICPKVEDLIITLEDNRIVKDSWNLYATIDNNLKTDNNDILSNSLIFIDDNNVKHILSENKTIVYTQTIADKDLTNIQITFKQNEKLLLQILNPIINNKTYKTTITWFIE